MGPLRALFPLTTSAGAISVGLASQAFLSSRAHRSRALPPHPTPNTANAAIMCFGKPGTQNKRTQNGTSLAAPPRPTPGPPQTRAIPSKVPGITTELFASRVRERDLVGFLERQFGKGTWKVELQNDRYIVVAPRPLTAVSWLHMRRAFPACVRC